MVEFKDAVDWERELEECQKKVKRLEEVIEERETGITEPLIENIESCCARTSRL